MKIGLIGNQNCGKTTLFNKLTGGKQHVGNFPGVTVEKREGFVKGGQDVVVDLPGIYSLSPYSLEEVVTRDFLFEQKPDCIINIVDATSLQRNLYLTLQLIEANTPLVLALNMMDEVRNNGTVLDVKELSNLLGVPVVPISAIKGEGLDLLMQQVSIVAKNKSFSPRKFAEPEFASLLNLVEHVIEKNAKDANLPRWYSAVKFVEEDDLVIKKLQITNEQQHVLEHILEKLKNFSDGDGEVVIVEMRYQFIEKLFKQVVKTVGKNKNQIKSEKIDKVLTHKFFALPIFFAIMFGIFLLTFGVLGSFFNSLMEQGVSFVTDFVDGVLTDWEISRWLHSLVVDGIFGGVGSVLSFLPTIVLLFFFLSLLEDSGYMARVAYVVDKLLRKIGLSGRSFVPMLIGFGCSVPAILSARTLASERDRKMTILLIPFMSCSAKLPVYGLFSLAFFPNSAALVMISLYLIGMVVGVLYALVLNKTVYKGSATPFLMELPPYRLPSAKNMWENVYEKGKDFVKKAFTFIFVASLVVWFLQSFDLSFNFVTQNENSILAKLGMLVAPLFNPIGITDWRVATSILTGFTAKEAILSTLAVLFGVSMDALPVLLSSVLSPLSAFSFLVFVLLYVPCVAAIATLRKEVGKKFTFWAMVAQVAIAYAVAACVYGIGSLFF